MDTRKNRVNAAPVSFGVLHLNALALALRERYPDIEIDIEIDMTLNDRFIDLAIEGVDVALRIGGDWPQDVVARQVAAFERTVVASPAYLKTHAKIRRVDDIAKRCLPAIRLADERRHTDALKSRRADDKRRHSCPLSRQQLISAPALSAAAGAPAHELRESAPCRQNI